MVEIIADRPRGSLRSQATCFAPDADSTADGIGKNRVYAKPYIPAPKD